MEVNTYQLNVDNRTRHLHHFKTEYKFILEWPILSFSDHFQITTWLFTFLNNQMFQAMENKQDNKSLQILFW